MKLKINKGDTVKVIAGAEKGKTGAVLSVLDRKLQIVVQGVNMKTHFDKEKGQFTREGAFDYSNVQFIDKASSKASSKKASSKN